MNDQIVPAKRTGRQMSAREAVSVGVDEKIGADFTSIRNKTRHRIALIGQFGVGNFGNDGSLEAMILALRRICPGSSLTVICTDPDVVSRRYDVDAIKITRPPIKSGWLDRLNSLCGRIPYKLYGPVRAYLTLRGVDTVILPGTGAFDDFGDTPFGMPYVFLKWLAMARLRRCNVIFASIGAGPAYHYLSRAFFSAAIRCATFRTYRDAISLEFVKSLGIDTSKDHIFPDLAFGLPAPHSIRRTRSGPVSIGLGVMNYRGRSGASAEIYERYISKLADFVQYAVSCGYAVNLILGQDNDEVAAIDIIVRLERLLSVDEFRRLAYKRSKTLYEVMVQMQANDVIVATRFHNVICALCVGRPVISLGYLEKHDVLAADMGLSEYCADVEQFSVDWLTERLEHLVTDRDARSARISETVGRYGQELLNQEKILQQLIYHERRGSDERNEFP